MSIKTNSGPLKIKGPSKQVPLKMAIQCLLLTRGRGREIISIHEIKIRIQGVVIKTQVLVLDFKVTVLSMMWSYPPGSSSPATPAPIKCCYWILEGKKKKMKTATKLSKNNYKKIKEFLRRQY